MSNKANKPQWLIDAQQQIEKFEETKFGAMTEQQMRRHDAAKNNGALADKKKAAQTRLKNLPNNPELQQALSNAGKVVCNMRKERGDYQTEEFKQQVIKSGKARQALLSEEEKRDLGRLANASRTEEGKSKAGKARAAKTNAIVKKCPHCSDPGCNVRTYARYHGDKCIWIKHSEYEVFGSIGKETFTRKDIVAACKKFGIEERRAINSNYITKIKKGIYKIK